jgi:hypothetical protein
MKKKASHVGIILSFVVFITFVVFLFSILSPSIQTNQDKQFVMDYLKQELQKQFSGELEKTTISIDPDNLDNKDCITLIGFMKNFLEEDLVVKVEEERVDHSMAGNQLSFERGNFERIAEIYYSEELNSETGSPSVPCDPIQEEDYNIKLVKDSNPIFYSKIETATNNFEDFKASLEIPPQFDFSFELESSEGEIIFEVENKIPQGVDVFSEQIPIQYLDENAELMSGFINIKVW